MSRRSVHITNFSFLLPVVAIAMIVTACGSKKMATRVSPPRNAAEISLDELVGSGSFVVTPSQQLSERARAVVDAAHKWLGTVYKYGGETHRGVDCSALVMNVYKESLGIKLPRTSAQQRKFATPVKRDELQPGDLVFFSTLNKKDGISHVGLYIGNDRFIHASSSRGVVVSRLSDRYFVKHYHSSGRVAQLYKDYKKETLPTHSVESAMESNADLLEAMLNAAIDSIYSMPVDNDPNLAPGL